MPELAAGVGRRVITPPIGSAMRGFAGRGHAVGVHDELMVTAIAWQAGDTPAIWLTADLCLADQAFCQRVAAAVQAASGVDPDRVILSLSHTHYGPPVGDPAADAAAQRYDDDLVAACAGAAGEALVRLTPIQVGWAETVCHIGVNRRERRADGRVVLGCNPAGPCDRSLIVVRLETAERRPVAALVNFACHPVSGGSGTRLLSAGWPGAMRLVLERELGCPVLFCQGAAANINSILMEPGLAAARRLGREAAGAALTAWHRAQPQPAPAVVAVAREEVALPRYRYGCLASAEALAEEFRRQLDRLGEEAAGQRWWANYQLTALEEVLADYRGEAPLPAVAAEVTGWRVGDLALATMPGEIFCETGMAVKQSQRHGRTLFAAYTGGSIGYVPVPEAYPEGGYEVDRACRVDPAAEGLLRAAAGRVLAGSWSAGD